MDVNVHVNVHVNVKVHVQGWPSFAIVIEFIE